MAECGAAYLRPAVDTGPQPEGDESLNGVRQLRLLQVVIEHAGRAGVSHEVDIALLQAAQGEPPVPLCAALRSMDPFSWCCPMRLKSIDTAARRAQIACSCTQPAAVVQQCIRPSTF